MRYVLFLMILAVTVFNLFATATAKRRKGYSNASFALALKPVEEALLKEQKERKLHFDVVKRLANDSNQVIVYCYDSKAKVFALGTAGSILIDKACRLSGVQRIYTPGKGKRLAGADVRFTLDDTVYTYNIASKPFHRRGLVGSVLVETTEELYEALSLASKDAGNDTDRE